MREANIDTLDERDRRLLDLLSEGLGSRDMAQRLGYKDGTVRVYLHALYRRLNVPNRTTAVTWYLAQTKRLVATSSHTVGAPVIPESLGEYALRLSLHDALGMMSVFLGAYGRQWEVAMRLKDTQIKDNTLQLRKQTRALWDAMLKGDFMVAKRMTSDGEATHLTLQSPSDAVLLACSLLLGGFTHVAEKLINELPIKRAGSPGIKANEARLMQHLRDSLYGTKGRSAGAVGALLQLTTETTAQPALRHLMIVTLYHVYVQRGDRSKAVATANALWAEAESVRLQLQAIGEPTFDPEAVLPAVTKDEVPLMTKYLDKVTA
jgi:DNA-binding CsgD family transcriptional regulator